VAVSAVGRLRLIIGAAAGEDVDPAEALAALVFPPPPLPAVRQFVYSGDWRQRLAHQTGLAAPRKVAQTVTQAVSQGRSIRELARALQPVLDGVRSSARRVAHDEVIRVSHAMQEHAWDQAGELVVGFTVNAVDFGHSPRSRPEHRKRHGREYLKRPAAGQRGMDECPHPPYESPRDGSKLAYNCRCFLTPILAPL
jgi:hypothetical protein